MFLKVFNIESPLHIACRNECVDIVRLLLSHEEIDVNAKTGTQNRVGRILKIIFVITFNSFFSIKFLFFFFH